MKILLGYFTFLAALTIFLVFAYMLTALFVCCFCFAKACLKEMVAYCKQKTRKKGF